MNNSSLINIANNQSILVLDNQLHFYSYGSYICSYNKDTHELTLNNDMWDYSNTTRKYFKKFLEEYTAIPYINKSKFVKMLSANTGMIRKVS